jgi:hypothetical protein
MTHINCSTGKKKGNAAEAPDNAFTPANVTPLFSSTAAPHFS